MNDPLHSKIEGTRSRNATEQVPSQRPGFGMRDHRALLKAIINAYDSFVIRAYCKARFLIINVNILNILSLCVREKPRLLDIGCGFGLFGCYLATRYPEIEYHGFDLNPRRIDMAREAAKRLGLKNAHFDCADARDLSINDQYDAIMMVDLLHHIDNDAKRALLAKCCSHLSPGGHLVVKDVTRHPRFKIAFTWLLDVLMTRSVDMWYIDEVGFAEALADATWAVDMFPIADLLPYPHVVYLCQRGS